MNNGDKIRSMTDDKLAKLLYLLKVSDCGINSFDECKTCIANGLCQTFGRKQIKEWLKSEVKQ